MNNSDNHIVMQVKVDDRPTWFKSVPTGKYYKYYEENWGVDHGMWIEKQKIEEDGFGRYIRIQVITKVKKGIWEYYMDWVRYYRKKYYPPVAKTLTFQYDEI